MKRVFLAIPLPENIRAFVGDVIKELRERAGDRGVKWVDPVGAHITAYFLGNQNDEAIAEIASAVKPIAEKTPAVKLETAGIDCFPNINAPRVIFLDTREAAGNKLSLLIKEAGRTLAALGHKIDDRPRKAHITLGRVKGNWQCPRELPKFTPQEFIVKEITLFESELTPRGSKYTLIETYPLK